MSECGSKKCEAVAAGKDAAAGALGYFSRMIANCLGFVEKAKGRGRPVVGIMCEFTPRELMMAAGGDGGGGNGEGVAVCLCGGTGKTIAAAERDLPTNLCPLIKSTYGYHVMK
ncbi:MAG: hypothetical protein FWD61_18035, partial [Phycisphaerales bacterium]|nr:hypothetical protein [Phycisphaerales bacterium]